jgi:hypothetical protein
MYIALLVKSREKYEISRVEADEHTGTLSTKHMCIITLNKYS